jgi:hypothetical protein
MVTIFGNGNFTSFYNTVEENFLKNHFEADETITQE